MDLCDRTVGLKKFLLTIGKWDIELIVAPPIRFNWMGLCTNLHRMNYYRAMLTFFALRLYGMLSTFAVFSFLFHPYRFPHRKYHVANQLLFHGHQNESYDRAMVRTLMVGRFLNMFHLS
jgi:hypothetical protein